MQFQELIIKGNKRFLNKGTRQVVYKPHSPLQLIIGKNGFGKSSLMNELSPLPGINSDYVKGGLKVIKLTHNDHHYVLTSDFTKGAHHSFLKDGTELNPGGTFTIQKSLVAAEFRYTPEIHQLRIGKVRFTDLTAQKRKEWFVRLCDTDVTYATKKYVELMARSRNIGGAIKHVDKKYIEAAAKLLPTEEMEEIESRLNDLNAIVRELMESKTRSAKWCPNADGAQLKMLSAELRKVSQYLMDVDSFDMMGCDDVAEMQQVLHDSKIELAGIQANLKSKYDEFHSIEEIVQQLAKDDERSIPSMESELQQWRDVLASQPPYDSGYGAVLKDRSDLEDILSDLNAVDSELNEILMGLPINHSMEQYNRTVVGSKELALKERQKVLDVELNRLENLQARLEGLKGHNKVDCPNCSHSWIPGVSEREIIHLEKQITQKVADIELHKRAVAELMEWMQGAEEWKSWWMRYVGLSNTYSRLGFLWNDFVTDFKIHNEPKSLLGKNREAAHIVKQLMKIRESKIHISTLEQAIIKRRRLDGNNLSTLTDRMHYIEQEIRDLMHHESRLKGIVEYESKQVDTVSSILKHIPRLEELTTNIVGLYLKHQIDSDNQIIDGHIAQYSSQIGLLHERVKMSSANKAIVESLEQSKEDLLKDEAAYALLLKALSPTDGLIADTLSGFIRTFVAQMNDVIKRVWTDPLAIKACGTQDGDLDYQFPLYAADGTHPVSDISCGSDGEREMINFAFQLIAGIYLDMQDYPLLLDEVGRHFHELHRTNLYNYIKLLVESHRVEQVYVISHFPSTHGSLTHADVNVIDPTGVMITPDVNKYLQLS